jgi:hypothetical protein
MPDCVIDLILLSPLIAKTFMFTVIGVVAILFYRRMTND